MNWHVIVVSGLKRDERKELGFKDSDEQPVMSAYAETAFGPLPSGTSYHEILKERGWVHIGKGIYSKIVGGVEYRATNKHIPDLIPLDLLP